VSPNIALIIAIVALAITAIISIGFWLMLGQLTDDKNSILRRNVEYDRCISWRNSLEYQRVTGDIYMPDGTAVNNYNNSCSTITGAFYFS
jgi:hypothetical protein